MSVSFGAMLSFHTAPADRRQVLAIGVLLDSVNCSHVTVT